MENTELIVAFGGIPEKNVFVTPGGTTRHGTPGHLAALASRGTEIVLISPLRSDLPNFLNAQWHPVVPATDVALMLGLAHTLVAAVGPVVAQALARHGIEAHLMPEDSFFMKPLTSALEEALRA